ncbi:MAG TPA: glutamate--tRNA ligase [Chitinispirillaceae bacterium]|nr:glutamate--tRNA ligase [Chitinispirillaceae bacterium]
MNNKVRVRFAPSPTGYLHVGGARSALFNYLFARRNNGTFILRIEDTDQNRFVEGALKEIYDSLKWLGLQWDEGPEAGGDFGPYVQSQRIEIYNKYANQLLESGHAYRCFCTAERLAQLRTEQEKTKQTVGYDRCCKNLSDDQIKKNLADGIPYVIRFKVPSGRTVVFEDKIRGMIEYSSDILDDLVLIKSDRYPTYHMASVVDDHLMQITHVLRGDEWIASTPRHVLIYEAFGWTPPVFAHLPVILSPDGGKLSKRKGAASVMDYKRAGFLPEALFNFLALLGWAPGDSREKMSLNELIESFSLEQVSPKASVFDEKKLEWMNGLYLTERSSASLIPEILPVFKEKGWVNQLTSDNDPYLLKVIDLMKSRSKRLTDLVDSCIYFFKDPISYEEKAMRKYFTADAVDILSTVQTSLSALDTFTCENMEKIYHDISEKSNISAGKLIHPTRLAVSGVSFGPGLFELLETLGKDIVIRRITTAINFIRGNLNNNG